MNSRRLMMKLTILSVVCEVGTIWNFEVSVVAGGEGRIFQLSWNLRVGRRARADSFHRSIKIPTREVYGRGATY
jgi:hypothetical protein